VVPGTRIIGTYGGLDGWYRGSYLTGAVRNEKTSCKGVGSSLLVSVGFADLTERFLVFDLLRLLIAYLLNTLRRVAVKEGRLYRTESDCKGMRSGM
jgi:hypothetical protein